MHSDPFGKDLANQDIDNDNNEFVLNLRFQRQYFDVETNTHYNYLMDYEEETGRYLQNDPIGLDDGINSFSYVKNDPVFWLEPLGSKRFKSKCKPTTCLTSLPPRIIFK